MPHQNPLTRLFSSLLILALLLGAFGLTSRSVVQAAPAKPAGRGALSAEDWRQIQSLLPAASQFYLKAFNTDAYDHFGYSVAISGDTVVVGALDEDSDAKGVSLANDGLDNRSSQSGAVYVFVRGMSGGWSQQAYIKASNTMAGDQFGKSVDISGNTIVVGAPGESNIVAGSGAVYVFVRAGTTWSEQAYLKAGFYDIFDSFGSAVAVDGDRIVVGVPNEQSTTSGVNSTRNRNGQATGAAYLFVRSGETWSQQAYIKASNPDNYDYFGISVDISGDTIVIGAQTEDSSNANDQANNDANDSGASYVFWYDGSNWTQQAYLKASNIDTNDYFGVSVAISANTIVVGAAGESSNGSGVNPDAQANNGTLNSGAAYVFVRDSGTWSQQAYLKASNPGESDFFGSSVAISGNRILVGAKWESSANSGLNVDLVGDGARLSGAAYLYGRIGSTWSQQAAVKASNTDEIDNFGYSVAISPDTILAGANLEDSSATGVNGNQVDNGATDSGAAYLYYLAPQLLSFSRQDPAGATTNADTLTWRAVFDLSVQNVSMEDFAVSGSTAAVTAVTEVDSTTYDITVSGGDLAELNSSIGLNLAAGQDIQSLLGVALADGEPAVDELYTLDNTAPGVLSSKRASPHPTDADQVDFTVTFKESVTGVDTGDFSLTSPGLSGAALTSVSGSGAVYTVTAYTGTGSGYLRLNLPNTATINDLVGNLISGLPYNIGQTYIIDRTSPTVSSILRASVSPSSADSLDFMVIFSESVMDVELDDFSIFSSGLTGAALQSLSGSGRNYVVSLDPGYGGGTLRLDLPDTASFIDLNGNLQSGLPYTGGQSYAVNRLPASFSKSTPASGATSGPSPTLSWETSSLAVDGYAYCLVLSSSTCSSWTSVAGTSQAVGPLSNGSYKWQVRALNPGGQTYANGAEATSWSFTVDATKPVVSAIALADPNPSTAASLRYTVTFSENVTGVDKTDFGLTASTVTGAAVTAVSAVSAKVYTVTISTGTGTGTLRLDIKADGTIVDAVGNSLSAAYSSGPKYTLDRLNTFTSTAANDGWVLESTETSNTGNTLNSTLDLLVGDSATKQQYRSILSFDTSGLPDTAVIVKVTLKLRKVSGTGVNPFSTFQGLQVGVKQGFFGSALTLQAADFIFAPSLANAGTVTLVAGSTSDYQSVLLNTAWPFVSKTASTQLRLAFKLDDNNNAVADTVSFASGNHLTAAYRPVLVVEYTLP